jgi:SAM-dependent methyltransferase
MRNDIILQHVVGPDVLDVGCSGHEIKPGSPYWLHGRLQNKFPATIGIDINQENINQLLDLGYENIYLQDAEDFAVDKKFDTIVAGELIEHLANPGRFLQRCRMHLKPGGRVIITTPYVFSLMYILYALVKYPRTCQNPEHTVWFGLQTLTELANRNGFIVYHWELIQDYELDNSSLLYRWFARMVTTIGRVTLPKRLRNNNLFFILTPQD